MPKQSIYQMTYDNLQEQNRNKQTGLDDFHLWVVDKNGKIKDNFALRNKEVKIVYKEWENMPDVYQREIDKYKKMIGSFNKIQKIELFKALSKMDNICLQYSVLLHILYGYDIKIGSLGIVCNNNKILWEYGNGLNNSDY